MGLAAAGSWPWGVWYWQRKQVHKSMLLLAGIQLWVLSLLSRWCCCLAQSPDQLATPSVRNDAAFLFSVTGEEQRALGLGVTLAGLSALHGTHIC